MGSSSRRRAGIPDGASRRGRRVRSGGWLFIDFFLSLCSFFDRRFPIAFAFASAWFFLFCLCFPAGLALDIMAKT